MTVQGTIVFQIKVAFVVNSSNGLLTLFEEFSQKRPEILKKYRELSCLDGKEVTVDDGRDIYRATVLGINDDFTLSVVTEGGEQRSLVSGDVSLRINRIPQV